MANGLTMYILIGAIAFIKFHCGNLNVDDDIDFIFGRFLYDLHGRVGDRLNFGALRMFAQLERFAVAETVDFEVNQIKFADFQFGARQERLARK